MKPPRRSDPQIALVKTKTRKQKINDLAKGLEKSGMSKAQAHVEMLKVLALSDVLEALGKITSSLTAIDRQFETLNSSVRTIDLRLVFIEQTIRLRGEKAEERPAAIPAPDVPGPG